MSKSAGCSRLAVPLLIPTQVGTWIGTLADRYLRTSHGLPQIHFHACVHVQLLDMLSVSQRGTTHWVTSSELRKRGLFLYGHPSVYGSPRLTHGSWNFRTLLDWQVHCRNTKYMQDKLSLDRATVYSAASGSWTQVTTCSRGKRKVITETYRGHRQDIGKRKTRGLKYAH